MEFHDYAVKCPYNKYHIITESRLQRHLVKCEKNYPPGYLSICPFNATHRMPKDELEEHIQSCPQQKLLNPASYQQSPNTLIPPINKEEPTPDNEDDETWDKEIGLDVEINPNYREDIHYGPIILDERIPNWVQQTMEYPNKEIEEDMEDEIEIDDSVSQVSSNYGLLEKLLKKIQKQKQ